MRKSWILPLITLVAAALGTTVGVTPASAASNTPLRVMPLGDSITWGAGSSTGNGYRGPLWNELAADGHPLDFVGTVQNGSMSEPDNEGHPGYHINEIAALADASLTRYRPNVVTLHIGTNDLIGASGANAAITELKSLVNQITADVPDATVLVASLVVSTNSSEEQWRGTYNQAIPQIVRDAQAAGKHVAFVDMSSVTTADLADPLHPNDSGYQKMADAFHRGVQSADSAGWLRNPAPAPALVQSAPAPPTGPPSRRGAAATAPTSTGPPTPTAPCAPWASASTPPAGPTATAPRCSSGPATAVPTRSGSPTTAVTATPAPAAASMFRAPPRPTAHSSCCGTATAAPTRSGPL
jgi:lysophospholipase L1-like esterase